jgi:hypothetical protein
MPKLDKRHIRQVMDIADFVDDMKGADSVGEEAELIKHLNRGVSKEMMRENFKWAMMMVSRREKGGKITKAQGKKLRADIRRGFKDSGYVQKPRKKATKRRKR